MKYKNYIFDLYGTLIDIKTDESQRKLWDFSALFYSENGAGYSSAELRKRYKELCTAEQEKHRDLLYEIDLRRIFRTLYKEKGINPSKQLVDDTAVAFRIYSNKKMRLYPWVLPFFEWVRNSGGRLYLLSNAQECFTVPELKVLGLYDRFDGIVISSCVRIKKPDRRIMDALTDKYDINIGESVMIGNEQKADMGVAEAAGMDGLYLQTETSGTYDKDCKAVYEILDGNYESMYDFFRT